MIQPEILIATSNAGKISEIRAVLSSLPIKLRRLDEFPAISAVEEIGRTYEENATLKALSYVKQTSLWALADDSGLEVDALNGQPGVFSARFGGGNLSDRERTQQLLAELAVVGDSKRTARFVCTMVLAAEHSAGHDPQVLNISKGVCAGILTKEPHGANGFGFDPIFVPTGYKQTFAELPLSVKNKISHRAQALEAMRKFLSDWLAKLDRASTHP
jgi:XTP/dITP diphosphohydrolase